MFIKDKADMLIPSCNTCIFCNKELFNGSDYSICDECFKLLPQVRKTCEICGQEMIDDGGMCLNCKNSPKKFYNRAFSPFRFEGLIVDSVHRLKYHNDKWVGRFLGKILYDYVKSLNLNVDIVIPVPLNENRLKERGYNQSKLLCEEFYRKGYEVDETNLIRVKDTASQTNFTFKQREENVKNAFKIIDKEKLNGKNVLVVDDVYTTGATLNEISETLRKTKVNYIYCLTLAHVVRPILTESNKLL